VRGERIDAPVAAARMQGAQAIDATTLAIGPDTLRARLDGKRGIDDGLAVLAEEAMPQGAPGASLRVAARLSPSARAAIADVLDVRVVPPSLSAWGDVVDDLAIVALLHAEDIDAADNLAEEARALERKLDSLVIAADLPPGTLGVERHGDIVRITWVVGPKALRVWAERRSSIEDGDKRE
jgi:hypothetical protein